MSNDANEGNVSTARSRAKIAEERQIAGPSNDYVPGRTGTTSGGQMEPDSIEKRSNQILIGYDKVLILPPLRSHPQQRGTVKQMDEKMRAIIDELKTNANDWTSVSGEWEGYATTCCAIVYPDGRVEYAWCGENMESVLRDYAEANNYFFITSMEVA